MRVIIKNDYNSVCYWTASYIKNKIMENPDKQIVIGLPTGSTPIGVYKYLITFYIQLFNGLCHQSFIKSPLTIFSFNKAAQYENELLHTINKSAFTKQ